MPTTQVRMVSAHWAQILFAIDLDCFINTLTQQLSKCSNAMFVAMGKLVSVVARVAVEERRQMIKMVSLIYLDSPAADGGRQSRVAEIACPNGPWLTNRSRTCPPPLAVCRPNERCTVFGNVARWPAAAGLAGRVILATVTSEADGSKAGFPLGCHM